MDKKNRLKIVILIALVIKLSLFVFAEFHAPEAKFEADTADYLNSAIALASKGAFAQIRDASGNLSPEFFRTPGYPFFLGVLHVLMRIPLAGVIFIQVLLTMATALVCYKTALEIDSRLGFLTLLIILFDPPSSVYSLMLLTESLFQLLMALFMFVFILYLKKRTVRLLILAGLILAAATYVRPITYYLGIPIAVFIAAVFIREGVRKAFVHMIIFSVVVYSLLGMWQWRNYRIWQTTDFSMATEIAKNMRLLGSYTRNEDPHTQGMAPLPYYCNVTFRIFMSLMARPASLKYFGSEALTALGKTFSYPWIVFWWAGLIAGIFKMERNRHYWFFLMVIGYLAVVSVTGAYWGVSSRFRVPIMPFIAIFSAHGWIYLSARFKLKRKKIRL